MRLPRQLKYGNGPVARHCYLCPRKVARTGQRNYPAPAVKEICVRACVIHTRECIQVTDCMDFGVCEVLGVCVLFSFSKMK